MLAAEPSEPARPRPRQRMPAKTNLDVPSSILLQSLGFQNGCLFLNPSREVRSAGGALNVGMGLPKLSISGYGNRRQCPLKQPAGAG